MILEISKNRRIIGWSSAVLVLILFILSALKSYVSIEFSDNFNIEPYKYIIGIVQIIGATLYFMPKTNFYGTIILNAFLSIIIALSIFTNTGFIILHIVVLFIIWIGTYARNPHLFTKVEPTKCYKCSI